jgi:hypothetical protein
MSSAHPHPCSLRRPHGTPHLIAYINEQRRFVDCGWPARAHQRSARVKFRVPGGAPPVPHDRVRMPPVWLTAAPCTGQASLPAADGNCQDRRQARPKAPRNAARRAAASHPQTAARPADRAGACETAVRSAAGGKAHAVSYARPHPGPVWRAHAQTCPVLTPAGRG